MVLVGVVVGRGAEPDIGRVSRGIGAENNVCVRVWWGMRGSSSREPIALAE